MKYKQHKQYRLQNRHYVEESYYFITICTKNREHFFGEIVNADEKIYLKPTKIGEIIPTEILKIEERHENIILDEWVVMPNHVHLILFITNKENTPWRVPTIESPWDIPTLETKKKGLQPLIPNSISSAINHFKGAITKWGKQNRFENFAWQSRFHDHVIRNEDALTNIRYYIEQNPVKWAEDIFNPLNHEKYQKFIEKFNPS
jgi:putative transposase